MKLRSGGILPSSLVGGNEVRALSAFNKTYNNHALRAGIVVKRHEIKDKSNLSKLTVEYDVIVMEQDRNTGTTPIVYKNCLSTDGLGSIADHFEKKLRTQKKADKKSQGKDFVGQDGAIVLLLCLDGSADKGIIIGGLKHPDRKTKLVGKDELLAGEYNGIEFSIKEDGSANLTFKGATDNQGNPKDASQGNTSLDIEKDGSVEIKNKGVTQRIQKDGKYSLTTQDSVAITAKKQINVTTDDNLAIKAKKDSSLDTVKLAVKASGSCVMSVQSFDLNSEGEANLKAEMIKANAGSMVELKAGGQFSIEAGGSLQIRASSVIIDAQVALGGAGGMPALTMTTQFFGVGAMGPVFSQAIGPFSTKVTLL